MSTSMAMAHERDPKDIIKEAVGDLSGIQLFANQLLVGVYKRPEKTVGGIILTDNTRGEDDYQSKVGLILKVGPMAFQVPEDNDQWGFQHVDVKVGDWVVFRPSDGWNLDVNNLDDMKSRVRCRILQDTSVRMQVKHPDQVW